MAIRISPGSRRTRDFPIPRHPNYRITADGTVYDDVTGDVMEWHARGNRVFVTLDDNEYDLDVLLAWTFIGVLPFEVYRTGGSRPGVARGVGYRYRTREVSNDLLTVTIDGIVFRRIPVRELTRYYIGRSGVIYDSVTYRFTHHGMSDNGYPRVRLMKPDGEYVTISINRLVYLAWAGPITPGTEVDHIDADKTNNDYTNLQLLTHRDNIIKSHEQRKLGGRRKNGDSVFNHEMAEKLWRCMIDNNYTVRQVCDEFGITDIKPVSKLVYKIKMGTVYQDIKQSDDLENYNPTRGPRTRIDPETNEYIKRLYATKNYSLQEIADKLGVSYSHVQSLCTDMEPGKKTGRPKKYGDETVDAVIEKINAGMTQRQIAEEMGLSQPQVSLMARGLYRPNAS